MANILGRHHARALGAIGNDDLILKIELTLFHLTYQNFVRTGILTSSLFFENKSAIPSTCIYICKSDFFQSEFDDPLDILNVYELYMLMFVIFNFRYIETKIYLTFRIFCNQHVINV